MKAIILARVSTEEQMQDGQSIPAQLARSREYCARKKLVIWEEYPFDESSTKDQRKKFEIVIDKIKSAKERVALIAETIDRVQRSFRESVLLLDLIKADKVEVHFIRENLIIHKDSNSSEFLRWDMGVMFARGYVLQLSDNVKRSIEQKLRNGQWIGAPCIGYMNVTYEDGSKEIVVDPERAPFIQKIFDYYIAGTSIKLLAERMKKEGFRTKKGKPVASSVIHKILNESFYYGTMVVKGKEYPHKYPPLIAFNTFLKAQEVRKSWQKKPFKYASKPAVFRGLIKCAVCGCTVSPEFKKNGRYILYSCTNYRKTHAKKVYIQEKELLKPVYKALQALVLPQDKIDALVADLRASSESKTTYHNEAIESLDKQYREIQTKIDRMHDLFIDGSITKDVYDTKLIQMKESQADILLQKEDHTNADKEYYITASTVLDLAKRTVEIFERSEVDERRQFLNYLLQNCTLNGKKLDFALRNPFNLIAKYSNHPLKYPQGDSNPCCHRERVAS